MTYKPASVCSLNFREPPYKSGEWMTLFRNGSIEAESYDFSEHAQRCMGSDVAWILTLEPAAVRRVIEVLKPAGSGVNKDRPSRATLLRISEFCANYAEFKKLLNEHEIPYTVVFDGYA